MSFLWIFNSLNLTYVYISVCLVHERSSPSAIILYWHPFNSSLHPGASTLLYIHTHTRLIAKSFVLFAQVKKAFLCSTPFTKAHTCVSSSVCIYEVWEYTTMLAASPSRLAHAFRGGYIYIYIYEQTDDGFMNWIYFWWTSPPCSISRKQQRHIINYVGSFQ